MICSRWSLSLGNRIQWPLLLHTSSPHAEIFFIVEQHPYTRASSHHLGLRDPGRRLPTQASTPSFAVAEMSASEEPRRAHSGVSVGEKPVNIAAVKAAFSLKGEGCWGRQVLAHRWRCLRAKAKARAGPSVSSGLQRCTLTVAVQSVALLLDHCCRVLKIRGGVFQRGT